MKYFDVYKLEIKGQKQETLVSRDGAEDGNTHVEDDQVTYLIGYVVYEFEEDGTPINRKTYYVDRGTIGNDPDSVLDKIAEDHQPDMWQCNNW